MSVCLSAHRFLPESIPWLVMKGRVAEAESTLQRAARFNHIRDFPSRVLLPPSPPLEGGDVKKRISAAGGEVAPRVGGQGGRCSFLARLLLRCRRLGGRGGGGATPASYTIWDVLRHPRLRFFTFAMGTLW